MLDQLQLERDHGRWRNLVVAATGTGKTVVAAFDYKQLCQHAAYGVLALHERKVELLFVTLDKREGYHERIAYRDYAISPERFHWQSQNAAGPQTPAGRRYLDRPGNGWRFQLFVRAAKGTPYRACGPVTLERAEGAKPMSIHWRLGVPLPGRLFGEFSFLRGA